MSSGFHIGVESRKYRAIMGGAVWSELFKWSWPKHSKDPGGLIVMTRHKSWRWLGILERITMEIYHFQRFARRAILSKDGPVLYRCLLFSAKSLQGIRKYTIYRWKYTHQEWFLIALRSILSKNIQLCWVYLTVLVCVVFPSNFMPITSLWWDIAAMLAR